MEIKGWVYAKVNDFVPNVIDYSFWGGTDKDGAPSKYWISEGYAPVVAHTISFEPADSKTLVEGQIACLLTRKKKIETEAEEKIRKIDDALASLRCLEFMPTAEA